MKFISNSRVGIVGKNSRTDGTFFGNAHHMRYQWVVGIAMIIARRQIRCGQAMPTLLLHSACHILHSTTSYPWNLKTDTVKTFPGCNVEGLVIAVTPG